MSERTQRTGDIQFVDISESYPLSKDITVRYKTSSETSVTHNSRDWIALFRVGWTSNKDYHSYVWAAPSNHEDGTSQVVFPASSLPAESEHFYQFCYVTRDSALRGASPPFRFAATQEACEVIEEVVVAGGEMESMVVVRLKENKEDAIKSSFPKEVKKDETALVSFSPPNDCGKPEEKLSVFETSLFDRSKENNTVNAHSLTCTEQGSEKLSGTEVPEPSHDNVGEGHVHLRQSPAEVLDGRCRDLEVELNKERTTVKELTNQQRESHVTIDELEQQSERQRTLHQSLLEEERTKVRYLSVQQDESRAKMAELVEKVGEAKREAEELKLMVETLRSQLTETEKKLTAKQSELEEVRMEVMYNQQNISELVGALKEKGDAGHAHHRHGHAHHQGSEQTKSSGNTTQSCPVCGKVFPGSLSPQALEEHVQSHFHD